MGRTSKKPEKVKSSKENTAALAEIKENLGEGQPTVTRIGKRQREAMEMQARAEELETLYSADNFEGLVRLPMDIPLAVTGSKYFDMEDKEAKTLAASASQTAKYFVKTDPRWLVLALFLTNAALIYGGRTMSYFADKAEREREKRKAMKEEKSE